MKRFKLKVEKRKVLGKKVYKLRKEGILPANIYGKGIKSFSVQIPYKEFENVYKEAGKTGIVDVEVGGEIKPSLIHNVQQDYRRHVLLHADFFQVNLKEKVKAMIKIITVGEPRAVIDKLGLLMQTLSEIEVEALPTDLPDKIEINVESLAALDDQITVGEIKMPNGVIVLTDPSQVVAKIGELVSKEAQKQAAAEEAAQAEAKEAAAAEGGTEEEGKAPEDKKEGAREAKPEAQEQSAPQAKPQK